MFYSREAIADMLYEDTQFNIQLYDKLYKIMHGKERRVKCPRGEVVQLSVGIMSDKGSCRSENIGNDKELCRLLLNSHGIFPLKPLINSNYEPVIVEQIFSERKIDEGYCISGNHEDGKVFTFEIKHYNFVEVAGTMVNSTPYPGTIELKFIFRNKEELVEAKFKES